MPVIQVVSNRPGAGKTCLAGALLLRLKAAGRSVAYYKPLSPTPEADPDVAFMRRLLATYADPAPVDPPPALALPEGAGLSEEQLGAIAGNVAELDGSFDATLVEWAVSPGAESSPPALAGYPALLLYDYTGEADAAAKAVQAAELAAALGDDLAGVIINKVTLHRRMQVEREIVAILKDQGLPVLGALPEDRRMLALTVQQVADYLGGRWVQEPPEPADAGAWVDRFLIGGNIMDSGPNYFGRYSHQAVITRAGRPDIQMASLMGDTRLLALTGGEEPTEYIRVEAQKRATPLLLVDGNTLDTAEALAGLLEQANPYSEQKLARFAALMEQNFSIRNYELGIKNWPFPVGRS